MLPLPYPLRQGRGENKSAIRRVDTGSAKIARQIKRLESFPDFNFVEWASALLRGSLADLAPCGEPASVFALWPMTADAGSVPDLRTKEAAAFRRASQALCRGHFFVAEWLAPA